MDHGVHDDCDVNTPRRGPANPTGALAVMVARGRSAFLVAPSRRTTGELRAPAPVG